MHAIPLSVSYRKYLVAMCGDMHTLMAFIHAMGKRFAGSGFDTIIVSVGLIAEGSLDHMMKGKHVNRGLRIHKTMNEAILRLLIEAFIKHLINNDFLIADEEKDSIDHYDYIGLKLSLIHSISTDHDRLLSIDGMSDIIRKTKNLNERFIKFCNESCEDNPTFEYWLSYLQMSNDLLFQIAAVKRPSWPLMLETYMIMLPWFFAYDLYNYSRYFSYFVTQMQYLERDYPTIYQTFRTEHGFVVNQLLSNGFSGKPVDKFIENSIYQDAKGY